MPRNLTIHRVQQSRRKIKQIGSWAGVRWLRNQGTEFEHAYWIMFGKLPRR